MNNITNNEYHHHLIDKIAIYTGIISGLALYPQVYIVIVTKNITGLSSVSFCIILLNSLVWTIYAMHRRLVPLIISSALNTLASAILILFIL